MKPNILHGSAVAFPHGGVFLRGPSGSGKSDLCLRLMAHGGMLVSDDQVELLARQGKLYASTVETIKGLLEVRGIGLVRVDAAHSTHVKLIVDLVPRAEVPRMPDWAAVELQGIEIPRLHLHAFDSGTPAKILKALEIADRPDLLIQ
jgi:HPr kinase/phosphorylase